MWVALWRSLTWPVVASGLLFPAALGALTARGKLGLSFVSSGWWRPDLWLLLGGLTLCRIAGAVVTTAWTILWGNPRSGIVAVPVRLRSDMGRLFLLWAITVTPGTIALLAEGEILYVHCLRLPPGGMIPGLARLERVLLRLWG